MAFLSKGLVLQMRLFGFANAAELIMARGEGTFPPLPNVLLDNINICEGHINELYSQWRSGSRHINKQRTSSGKVERACSFPNDILPLHKRWTRLVGNNLPTLDKTGAEYVLKNITFYCILELLCVGLTIRQFLRQ